jgi:hypothetical protein
MKKIFTLFFMLTIPLALSAQWFGDGLTAGTAYYGVINASFPMQAWNVANYSGGIIYVGRPTAGQNDLEIGTGGILNISPGITVKFCTTSSDLRITGTGILNASGSASSSILFTRNIQATWGHITFEASTGNSIINYCIIEYGNKTGASIEGYGGGIHANTSNLSISNCIIRNNHAIWGGGLFVNQNRNPSISNCYVYNNSSGEGGGGFYFWNGAKSVVTNCIFDSNHCFEPSVPYYTGGGLAAQSGTSLKILNCTFVNNTSTQPTGKSIMLYTSVADLVLNCIVWSNTNSGNQFYLSGSNTIQYTAVIGSAPTGTGNFVLSTNNTDPTGPNFINPASANWSISFISPCRDAGTTPNPAVPLDFLGNSRVGPYDIGAYEDQYNTWKTTATSSNWNTAANWALGVPTPTQDVIIPQVPGANPFYPTGAPQLSFTIGVGKMMILRPGAQATFGTLHNIGTVRLESDATGIASLIVNNYLDNGTEEIQLYLTGNSSGTMWHYVSPPVTSLLATVLGSSNSSIVKYEENLITNNMNNGWVTYNGYHYDYSLTPPAWVQAGLNWSNLVAGSGYNYFSTANKTYTLTGTLNVSDVPVNLVYNSGGGTPNSAQGFNLIGNPFTCGLSWDAVVNANTSVFNASNIESTIYFRVNGLTYYYNNGFTVPNTYNTDGSFIPPMQGFFIKTNSNGITLNIPSSAKAHTSNKRYKKSSSAPHIRLQFENAADSDQTVIYFDDMATLSFDKMLDGRKAFLTNSQTNIYSVIDGTNYSINGIPYPSTSVTVPLAVNAVTTGSYTIKATELTGLENYKVYLNDKTQNINVNLADVNFYTFNLTAGTTADRFSITVTNVVTAVPENTISSKPFNIYSSPGNVNIQTFDDSWNGKMGGIRILDMTGRIITTEDNVEFSKDNLIQIPVGASAGIYMVELRSGMKRYVGKVVIK